MSEIAKGVFAGLPDAVEALVPELVRLPIAGEPLSDCGDCVMAPEHVAIGVERFAFDPDVRCCSYHPDLPNFLIGRALRRGGQSARMIRERLAIDDGIDAWGVEPDEGYKERDDAHPNGFGVSVDMRCPFWVGGDHACGIWQDRNAVCRTWFCRHAHGRQGQLRWISARDTVRLLEKSLAQRCVDAGEAPLGAQVSTAEWEAWFRWCADWVDGLGPGQLEVIAASIPELASRRGEIEYRNELPPPEIPDVVIAQVASLAGCESSGVSVGGYTRHDRVTGPVAMVDLFDRLDGEVSWRVAAAEVGVSDALIGELHRVGVLQEPYAELTETAEPPPLLVPSIQPPIEVDHRVILRGEDGFGCVVVPKIVFQLIAKLDGERPWASAVAEAAAEGCHIATESLIRRLYRIRALMAPEEWDP